MNNAIKLLPKRLRIRYYAFTTAFNAFVFLMVFAFALLLDKHIEAFLLLVAYGFVRYKFPTTFHHKSTYWCAFWSILSMWICIFTTLPLSASILSSIIVAVILCFILYKVQKSVDTKKELALTLEENERLQTENQGLIAKTKEFSLYGCSKDEFTEHCLKKRVRRDRIEYVWDILRSQLSVNELAEKYFVEPQTINQDRWRYRKKLT